MFEQMDIEIDAFIEMIEAGANPDDCLALYDKLQWMKQEFNQRIQQTTEWLIQYMRDNNIRQVEFGPKKLVLTKQSPSYKCRSAAKTAHSLMEAVGGDFDEFGKCLASQAFKPATTRDRLGQDEFDSQFETEQKDKLVLSMLDPAFVKTNRSR